MASWDDEDYDTGAEVKFNATDKWDGEDEDDDIMDNWDDDEDENKGAGTTPVSQPKKKKPLGERIKEKEEKRRLERLAKEEERKKIEEENKTLTPEEELEERLKNQRLQEESDLELAKEAFGVTDTIETIPAQKTIDNFEPSSKEEFTELAHMISKKLTTYEQKSDYSSFLEQLFRDCCTGLDSENIKKISAALTILASEKIKLNKAKGGKKKGGKNNYTLTSGKGTKNDMDIGGDNYYDEYDDFM